jgi:hypothetical protein
MPGEGTVEGREQHTMDGRTQNKGKTLPARPIETMINGVSRSSDPRLSETRHTPNRP